MNAPRRTRVRTGTRKPRGRPSKCTDPVRRAILAALGTGCTREGAAAAGGVDRRTLYDWIRTNPEFTAAVEAAEGQAEVLYTNVMALAAQGKQGDADWKAGESWLKRRRRADYGDSLDLKRIDDETLLRLLHASQEVRQEAITEDGLPARIAGDDAL